MGRIMVRISAFRKNEGDDLHWLKIANFIVFPDCVPSRLEIRKSNHRAMGKKHRHHHEHQRPTADSASLEARALRDMARERFRDARETYKLLCKHDREKYLPGLIDANQGLMEQLLERGQTAEASHVLEALKLIAPASSIAAMKIVAALKEAKWRDAFQSALRFLSEFGGNAFKQDRLLVADALVLAFPNMDAPADSIPVALGGELRAVLDALRAFSEERYEAAQESLRPLSRNSNFAQWKILIKGWIAFHSGDRDKAAVLFDQLPTNGVTTRAAAPYRTFFAQGPLNDDASSLQALRPTCLLLGNPEAGAALAGAEKAWRAGKPAMSYLEMRTAPGFPSERTDWLGALTDFYFKAVPANRNKQRGDYLIVFTQMLLNKGLSFKSDSEARFALRTMGREALEDREHEMAEQFWRDYLARCPMDSAGRSKQAALVLARVAELCAQKDPLRTLFSMRAPHSSRELVDSQKAIDLLEECVSLDASNLQIHLKLLDLYEIKEMESDKNRLLDRMTRQFPQESAVLVRAGKGCLERKAFAKGLEYLERAHSLNPLDEAVIDVLMVGYLQQARQHFEKGKAKLGRNTFTLAERFSRAADADFNRGSAFIHARRGVLELLFGDAAEGTRHHDLAQERTASRPVILFFTHCYHRACSRKREPNATLWTMAKREKPQTGAERLQFLNVFRYAVTLDQSADWGLEEEFTLEGLEPALDEALADELALMIPTLRCMKISGFVLFGKRLLKKALREMPDDPRFRLLELIFEATSNKIPEKSKLEELHRDLKQRGYTKEAGVAQSAIRELCSFDAEGGYDDEFSDWNDDDFDDDDEPENDGDEDTLDFSKGAPPEISNMMEEAAHMSPAEFDAFRQEGLKFIPSVIFDSMFKEARNRWNNWKKKTR